VLELQVQRASAETPVPSDEEFAAWATAALKDEPGRRALVIRVVGEAESRALNRQYRDQDRPTNVLSFPADLEPDLEELLGQSGNALPLGDLVICAPMVAREASEQGKHPRPHWAHLVVHGVLHLLGHDHQRPAEAQLMEATETALLEGLGFDDPYRMP
jgi:probable rRNA maturation factor